jgi:DNA primase large subunit
MADLLFCSHYPFTAAAKAYVSERGMEIVSSYVEKAEERVREAITTGKVRKVPPLLEPQQEELAQYAIARMIVSCANNRYLINRYAVAEAKKTSDYLSSDSSGAAAHPEYVDAVAAEFGIKFEKTGSHFLVPLGKYLSYTPRSTDYKLANREVASGKVKVSNHERVRMLEEAVKKKIERELPIRADFPAEVKASGARVLALLPKLESAVVKVGQENYPPCVKRMIEELSLNVNLPHTARVALAIYLVKAGVATGKIVDIFRGAPDFSEKTTHYQVEYLRTKGYSMPSCSTMDSYGVCIAECHCGTPLNFRADVHGRRIKQEEEAKR